MNISLQDKCLIIQGNEAHSLLENLEFKKFWDKLWSICDWATVFQHKDFVTNWFQFYSKNEPILITDWNGKSMTGLLVMTFFRNDQISVAGLDQAEYQTWLSTTEESDQFISCAIYALRDKFPDKKIHFKYLPSKTPLSWLKSSKKLKGFIFLRAYKQPLMLLDKKKIEAELKKKNRKEKINRLKRQGNLQFIDVQIKEEFEEYIDEMILQNDFRKGALYGKMIYKSEPQRKMFLLKMFEKGLLHVSILKLNEVIIASNAGFKGIDIVHLQGINSHSPFYSRYSPGILLFLILGCNLAESNYKYFDLTPGGVEGYKSMLSNTEWTTHELWVSDRKTIFLKFSKEKVKKMILNILVKFKIFRSNNLGTGIKIKNHIARWTYQVLNNLKYPFSNELNSVFSKVKCDYFNMPNNFGNTEAIPELISVRRNDISDLFLFDETGKNFKVEELLADSLKRIELGQQLISIVKEKKLVAVFWIISPSGKLEKEDLFKESYSGNFILSCSFYEHSCRYEMFFYLSIILRNVLSEIGNITKPIFEINRRQRQLLRLFKANQLTVIR